MFVGTFEHALDDKGRVVLPAPFRPQLAERGFVSRYQGCLALWTEQGFRDMADRLVDKVREGLTTQDAVRAFASDATEVRPDSQGRIVLPQRLRDVAGLGRELAIIGALDRIEIWDAGAWTALRTTADGQLEAAVTELGL